MRPRSPLMLLGLPLKPARRAFPPRLIVACLISALLLGSHGDSSRAAADLELPAPPAATSPANPTSAPTTTSSLPPITVQPELAAQLESQPIAPTAPLSFSGQRARQDVDHLAVEIGSRVAGSPAQPQAADYFLDQFQAAGLATERQDFAFPAFQDRGSSLQVQTPETLALNPMTMAYSASGEVSGELLSVGLARSGDFDPEGVAGKVALARRGETRFSEKVSNLAAAGAIGVVIFNNQPGPLVGSLTTEAALPTVALSQEQGEQLLSLLQASPINVRLAVDAEVQERRGQNVLAAKAAGESAVLIGAHYDSVQAGPGANDNASGTATVLELGRVIAGRSYPFTVRFVLFDAEEIGLLGSSYYVKQLDDASRAGLIAMLNLDMVGVGDRVSFGGDPALVTRAVRLARAAGIEAGRLSGSVGSASDHSSFQVASLPTLFVHRGEDPHYHSADDRAEYVVPAYLEVAGQLVLALLDELAAEHP